MKDHNDPDHGKAIALTGKYHPKASPAEMIDTIVGQLDSIHSVLKFIDLAAVDPGLITCGMDRISRRLADLTGGDERPRLWDAIDLMASEQPRFLAQGRLPRAAVSLLCGDEGIGKSLFWVWLVAYITTGKPAVAFGIPKREPGLVFVVVTEDGWRDIVRPRLEVVGADLSMIKVICVGKRRLRRARVTEGSALDPRCRSGTGCSVRRCLAGHRASGVVRTRSAAGRSSKSCIPGKSWRRLPTPRCCFVTHTNRVASPNARDRYGATGELRKKARMTLFAQTRRRWVPTRWPREVEHFGPDPGVEVLHRGCPALPTRVRTTTVRCHQRSNPGRVRPHGP